MNSNNVNFLFMFFFFGNFSERVTLYCILMLAGKFLFEASRANRTSRAFRTVKIDVYKAVTTRRYNVYENIPQIYTE